MENLHRDVARMFIDNVADWDIGAPVLTEDQLIAAEEHPETVGENDPAVTTPSWEEMALERQVKAFIETDLHERIDRGFEIFNDLLEAKDEAYHMYAGHKNDRQIYYDRKDWREFRKSRDLARQWWAYFEKINAKAHKVWTKLKGLLQERETMLETNPGLVWFRYFQNKERDDLLTPYLSYGEMEDEDWNREDARKQEWEDVFLSSRHQEILEEENLKGIDESILGAMRSKTSNESMEEYWEALLADEGLNMDMLAK